MHEIPRWRRVIRAAGRLAALYVATTLILLLAAGTLMVGVLPTLSDLVELWMPVSVAFLVAFLLLAIARRAGFVALWMILVGLWVFLLSAGGFDASYGRQFVAWSVLALPLYGLGMIGAPSTRRLARSSSLAIAIIWFCLIAAGFMVTRLGTRIELPSQIVDALALIWGSFPLVLGMHEVVRVWNATRDVSAAAAA